MDQEKQFIKNKDEIITTTLNRFVPMSVEEQKLFFVCSYLIIFRMYGKRKERNRQ